MFSGNERFGTYFPEKRKRRKRKHGEPGRSLPTGGSERKQQLGHICRGRGGAWGTSGPMLHWGGCDEGLLKLFNISFKEVTGMFRNSCAKAVSDINTLSRNLNNLL